MVGKPLKDAVVGLDGATFARNQQEIEQEFAGLLEANADGSLERNLAGIAASAGRPQAGQGASVPAPPVTRGVTA